MFMTMTQMNNPSSDINNESVSSNKNVSRSGIGTTPLLTNNFTHEAMLLSNGYKTGNAFHQRRAHSHFRGTINMQDILSNQSLLQSNMSTTSTMIDSSGPLK